MPDLVRAAAMLVQLFLTAFVIHAQDRANRADTREFLGLAPVPDAQSAKRGAVVYASNCAFCHGAKANGAEGPDLVRSTLVLHDDKGELIGPLVHSGRPDRGMPAFPGFTAAQLADIGQFLHMRVELAANRGLYKIPNVITGDARAGAVYFNGAGRCASCHSVTGDLAHIGRKFEAPDLQQALLYPTPSRHPRVTVTLPSGSLLPGVLKQLDDFNVSFYDQSGVYHSFALDSGVRIQVEDKLAGHRELLKQHTDSDMHNLTAYLSSCK